MVRRQRHRSRCRKILVPVELGIHEGLLLLAALSALIDTESSLEINLDFKITNIDPGGGKKFLFSIKPDRGTNSAGISVYCQNEFSQTPADNYRIYFNYSDGTYDGTPVHPGSSGTEIGFFDVDDWVSLKVILDFQGRQWAALAGDRYTNQQFDSFFDFGLIQSAINSSPIHVGWAHDVEDDIVYDPTFYTATAAFDNLSIYSPRLPGRRHSLLPRTIPRCAPATRGEP